MRGSRQARRVQPVWTALLTALVLLVQGLTPAHAMPRTQAGTITLELCTHDGLKRVAVPIAPAGGGGVHQDCCDHCVVGAALALPTADTASVPVRYAGIAAIDRDAPLPVCARSRAPPRPPSQGPPQTV